MLMKSPSPQSSSVTFPDGTVGAIDANGFVSVPNNFASALLNAGFQPVVGAFPSGAPSSSTAITTAGAGTLTAAAIVSGLIVRSGPTAAYTDTTDTAAAIIAALGGLPVGGAMTLIIKTTVAFVCTLAAGGGVTLAGTGVIPGNSVLVAKVQITAAGAVTITGNELMLLDELPLAVIATPDNGTTQALTAAMMTGAARVFHTSTGGTAPSLTTPAASAIIAAVPNWQVGDSYILRILNNNSGTATVLAGSGVTLAGLASTALTATWIEFAVTYTSAGAVTMTYVGKGTV